MTKIQTDSIEEGMILAEDVKTSTGKTLLTNGMELNTSHIKVLKTWGVYEVKIEGGEEEDTITFSEKEINAAIKEISHKFSHNDIEHLLFKTIMRRCAIEHLLRKSND